jgi:hypothetical protein
LSTENYRLLDVTLYGVVDMGPTVHQCFGGTSCLHLQGGGVKNSVLFTGYYLQFVYEETLTSPINGRAWGNGQDYWVFGLCPSFSILKNAKVHVSETGSVSVLKCGVGDTYSVGSVRKS